MTTKTTVLTVARAEALFTSRLATGSRPTYAVAEHAIRTALRTHGNGRTRQPPDHAIARCAVAATRNPNQQSAADRLTGVGRG